MWTENIWCIFKVKPPFSRHHRRMDRGLRNLRKHYLLFADRSWIPSSAFELHVSLVKTRETTKLISIYIILSLVKLISLECCTIAKHFLLKEETQTLASVTKWQSLQAQMPTNRVNIMRGKTAHCAGILQTGFDHFTSHMNSRGWQAYLERFLLVKSR